MPDASMPHSSGPEVGEELTEGRAVCERCRRPEDDIPYAGPLDVRPPADVCNRTWPASRAECDRLLLERADAAGAELAALKRTFGAFCIGELTAERDALAEALAEATHEFVPHALELDMCAADADCHQGADGPSHWTPERVRGALCDSERSNRGN